MLTSIGKFSKSFFIKLLVGIIILPFVFWGMGDVFRGGNQNVIATIESKKLSAQEFANYVNRLNLNEQQVENIKKGDLLEKILSEYIGKKVMKLEIEKSGIDVSDNSLRNIIKNDKLFFKDDKFSRTEYEKFLIQSSVTAPSFEKNIAEQESKRQFLSFLSSGISIPRTLVENEFKKENQSKQIKYINLDNYYLKEPSQSEIQEIYNKNKDFFKEEYKSLQFSEITPSTFSDNDEYNEFFFNQLDILENKVLDGQSFEDISKENNLKITLLENLDKNRLDQNKKKVEKISDTLFKKIFNLKKEKLPEVIKIENKYYLAEIKSISIKDRSIEDSHVLKMIKAQINFKNKIESNTSIAKDLSVGGYDKDKFDQFAKENNLELESYKIQNLKQNDIFSEGIIKRIFLMKDGEVDLITDSTLTKNYLVLAVQTTYKKINKDSNEFEQYEAKAKLSLINSIYETFDRNLNNKYKVELNKRTIERVKNSF